MSNQEIDRQQRHRQQRSSDEKSFQLLVVLLIKSYVQNNIHN